VVASTAGTAGTIGTDRVMPVVHVEPDYPADGFDGIVATGFDVRGWTYRSAYFGGVSAVGAAGAGGDPRRDGVGVTLVAAREARGPRA
jgi:gamma-glutamyltranspeptidase/glutathione hydrolase